MSNDTDDIKLTYLPAQARIRLVISKAACDRSATPPEDVVQRAVKRLEKDVADGTLAFYNLYRDRLDNVWKRMRSMKFKPDKKVAVTIAAGAPLMPEIQVTAGPAPFLASLTINAGPEKISTWRFEFLKLTVQKRMTELGIVGHPDFAMLQAVYCRALRGKKIARSGISAAPAGAASKDHFLVMPRGASGDLVLLINNIASIATETARASILAWLQNYVDNAAKLGAKSYFFLRDDVEGRLKSMLRGPERLSIDLPVTILAAIAEAKAAPVAPERPKQQATAQQQATGAANQPTQPPLSASAGAKTIQLEFDGAKYFSLAVDDRKLTVSLTIISDDIYDDPAALTSERLEAFLRAKNIKVGLKADAFDALRVAVNERAEAKTFEVAAGVSAIAPEEPYLYPTYTNKKIGGEGLSIRDRQQGAFVKRGDVIAEVAFKKPGKTGSDVYGKEIPFKAPELPQVTCNKHVESKGGLTFVALKDGIPQLTDTSVTLEPAYVHDGNVNLTSGNVIFDGPVVITGNVEYGAIVSTTGDLEVQGVIEECTIKCGGKLTSGGIISGPKGFVKVCGDATIAFISNATVEVRGNLTVGGKVTNSNILVRGKIISNSDDSLILGGHVEFGESMQCKHLGRGSGQLTRVTGGQDPFKTRRVTTLTKRLERLQKLKDEIKKGSRHLSSLKAASTTQRHMNKRENLKEALSHVMKIIAKTEEQLTAAQAQVVTSGDAKIAVTGILAQNCRITLGGKSINSPQDVAEVAIVTKRTKGSFIIPLADLKGAAQADDKKPA